MCNLLRCYFKFKNNMPCYIKISQIISLLAMLATKLTELDEKTNCAHFKTLGTNRAYFKLQGPKTLTRETLGINNVFWPKVIEFSQGYTYTFLYYSSLNIL
jgi:hypothetical protein